MTEDDIAEKRPRPPEVWISRELWFASDVSFRVGPLVVLVGSIASWKVLVIIGCALMIGSLAIDAVNSRLVRSRERAGLYVPRPSPPYRPDEAYLRTLWRHRNS